MRHAQLNLYKNHIGPEGAAAIGEALKVNGSLTSLDLGYNELCGLNYRGEGTYTAQGITAIAEALKANGSLKEVRSTSAHTQPSDPDLPLRHAQLNLYYNEIGPEGAAAIGEALKVNGSLKEVHAASALARHMP